MFKAANPAPNFYKFLYDNKISSIYSIESTPFSMVGLKIKFYNPEDKVSVKILRDKSKLPQEGPYYVFFRRASELLGMKNNDRCELKYLSYPEWILKIPRQIGPNEYMVVRGDFLRKISGNPDVFGDPSGWTKIYEANKSVISDPNMIYPYQIFVIPKN